MRCRKPTSCLSAENLCAAKTDEFCPRADANGEILANYCRASRKDFRDAVKAARARFADWSKQSAYLRGQILYRAAEMLEMRQARIARRVDRAPTASARKSQRTKPPLAVDRLVHYAGWTDKFSQIFGAVNPVASSHFNFTMPEPTGVVVIVCPDEPSLLGSGFAGRAGDSSRETARSFWRQRQNRCRRSLFPKSSPRAICRAAWSILSRAIAPSLLRISPVTWM